MIRGKKKKSLFDLSTFLLCDQDILTNVKDVFILTNRNQPAARKQFDSQDLRPEFLHMAISAYIPFLWIHHNGPGPILISFEHHSHGSPIQTCHIDHISSFAGPVDIAAVDVNAQVIRLHIKVLIGNWTCHNSEALQRKEKQPTEKHLI